MPFYPGMQVEEILSMNTTLLRPTPLSLVSCPLAERSVTFLKQPSCKTTNPQFSSPSITVISWFALNYIYPKIRHAGKQTRNLEPSAPRQSKQGPDAAAPFGKDSWLLAFRKYYGPYLMLQISPMDYEVDVFKRCKMSSICNAIITAVFKRLWWRMSTGPVDFPWSFIGSIIHSAAWIQWIDRL